MVLKMAERYYNEPTLFFDVTSGTLTEPIMSSTDGAVDVLSVPEIARRLPAPTLLSE